MLVSYTIHYEIITSRNIIRHYSRDFRDYDQAERYYHEKLNDKRVFYLWSTRNERTIEGTTHTYKVDYIHKPIYKANDLA